MWVAFTSKCNWSDWFEKIYEMSWKIYKLDIFFIILRKDKKYNKDLKSNILFILLRIQGGAVHA